MKRFSCLAWLSLLLLAAAPGFAQTGDRIYRLGILSPVELHMTRRVMFPELARLGYAEGRNLEIQVRVAPPDGLRDAVRDVIARRPDVIFAISEAVVRAAHNETKTIPIVMVGDDPVRLGLARSHARPGGNVTGVSLLPGELDAKRLHLLLEAVPGARRIAALVRRSHPTSHHTEQRMRAVADATCVELLPFDVDTPDLYRPVFAAMSAQRVEAVVIPTDPVFWRDRRLLAALATDAHIPSMCHWPETVPDGCLLGYGPSNARVQEQIAQMVARILAGASPADIPIEQPTRFDFLVNLQVAKALGIVLPTSILARADEVIE